MLTLKEERIQTFEKSLYEQEKAEATVEKYVRDVRAFGEFAFYDCTSLTSVIIGNGVEYIGKDAFSGCTGLTDVYYTGSESEWSAIIIGSENEPLSTATIHYNYVPEE